tara:strand:+ start:41 stop:541 length:501 start_codon:yes stop_codon:yes gene_type:complete
MKKNILVPILFFALIACSNPLDKHYVNRRKGFAFIPPSEWKELKRPKFSPSTIIAFESPNQQAYIGVGVYNDCIDAKSLALGVLGIEQKIREGFSLNFKRPCIINSIKGYEFEFTWIDSSRKYWVQRSIVLDQNYKCYVIWTTVIPERRVEFERLLHNSITSFKIL